MNTKENTIGLKLRSFRACIHDAFSETVKNSFPVMGKYWKFILAIAVIQAVLSAIFSTLTGGMIYVGMQLQVIPITVCLLLSYIVSLVVEASMFAYIGKNKLSWAVCRLIKTIPLQIIILLIHILLTVAATFIYTLCTGKPLNQITLFTVLLVALALIVPMVIGIIPVMYVLTKYMYEPKSRLYKGFFHAYTCGFKHWWLIFSTLLLAILCTGIVEITVMQPVHILTIIQNISEYSTVSQGDEPSLPASFTWIVALLGFFAAIIRIFTLAFINYSLYYAYGTIKLKTEKAESASEKLLTKSPATEEQQH